MAVSIHVTVGLKVATFVCTHDNIIAVRSHPTCQPVVGGRNHKFGVAMIACV